MKVLLTSMCLIFSFLLPDFGGITERIARYGDLFAYRTVGTSDIFVKEVTIQDDFCTVEWEYIASMIGVTDYSYTIENRQLKISLYGRILIDDFDYISRIIIPIHRESYDSILLCDDNNTMTIYEK